MRTDVNGASDVDVSEVSEERVDQIKAQMQAIAELRLMVDRQGCLYAVRRHSAGEVRRLYSLFVIAPNGKQIGYVTERVGAALELPMVESAMGVQAVALEREAGIHEVGRMLGKLLFDTLMLKVEVV